MGHAIGPSNDQKFNNFKGAVKSELSQGTPKWTRITQHNDPYNLSFCLQCPCDCDYFNSRTSHFLLAIRLIGIGNGRGASLSASACHIPARSLHLSKHSEKVNLCWDFVFFLAPRCTFAQGCGGVRCSFSRCPAPSCWRSADLGERCWKCRKLPMFPDVWRTGDSRFQDGGELVEVAAIAARSLPLFLFLRCGSWRLPAGLGLGLGIGIGDATGRIVTGQSEEEEEEGGRRHRHELRRGGGGRGRRRRYRRVFPIWFS
ncbi:uncharacterized protein LOC127570999 [Pristis pectinata]|uniref:uncharacterized protein LOC127570999 n=1 Tax=Pristis pectinata TaxID=685728 RepID=UPI00223E35BE|nr:uncharacterized protein LOC127570999 [Pristis pectinata]